MEQNKVLIADENGVEIELEVIATLKIEKKEYAIMHDINKDEDYIFTIENDADNTCFTLVSDDIELQDVLDAYYEL